MHIFMHIVYECFLKKHVHTVYYLYIFFLIQCLRACAFVFIYLFVQLLLCFSAVLFMDKKTSDPAARLSGIIIGPAQDLSLDEKAY